jgi:hypothetical protein
MLELMTVLFDNAKEKGEITSVLNSELLFDFLQGFIFTKVKKWHQQKKLENIHEAVDQILIFISRGLGYQYK